MTEFTPLAAVVGGTLIGIGAVMIMLFLGRVAGISGILSGAVFASSWEDWGWRAAFLAGMIAAPAVFTSVTGQAPEFMMPGTTAVTVSADSPAFRHARSLQPVSSCSLPSRPCS